jgi:hypothetical protein
MANNKNKRRLEQPLLDVNAGLRKNRSILKSLCPEGRAIVKKEILDVMGYNYNVFSSIYVNSKKQVYYICYDYAFTPIIEYDVKNALILAKQNFLNAWDPWRFIRKKV